MEKMKTFIIVLLIVAVATMGYYVYNTKTEYDTLTASLIESEVMHHTFVNGERVHDNSILIAQNLTWINYKTVKHYLDDDIWLSNSGSRIYIPLETLDVSFENNNLGYYIKQNLDAVNIPLYTVEEEQYVDYEILKKLYDISFDQYGKTRVLTVEKKKSAILPVGTQIYSLIGNGEVSNIILPKFATESEEEVLLLTEGNYTQVLFKDGRQGGVLTEEMGTIITRDIEKKSLSAEKSIETPETISLIWDDGLSWEDTFKFHGEEKIDGLNVISPVWFNLNVEGIVINSADITYSRKSHEKGYQVWGLYKNNFNPDWTNDLLNNEQYMKKSIAQLLFYASLYELDGINIDFENIYYKDKDALTGYVKAINQVLEETDLILSLDMTRPGGSERYSKVIDRSAINDHIDYFILMAYDEHWGSSPVAGSVASMGWTKESVELSLELVDRDKLILGIPLYTRLWKTMGSKVSSKAYAIDYIDEVLEGKYFDFEYDESSGQNFLTYQEDGATYQVWAEDKVSLQKRLEMAENFHLPGVAMWRKGYETPYVWELLKKYLQ